MADQLMVLMIWLVYQKKFIINFSKAKTKPSLSLHYDDDDNYLYVNQTDFWNLKQMIT